jgi:osmoprotectant transport system substrate-binding protein
MTSTTTRRITRRTLGIAALAAGAGALTACTRTDPLTGEPVDGETTEGASSAATGAGGALVVGSQQYYSNEIIAELYAQVLEAAGRTVERQYQIGQREIYLPELESGAIDVIPEYGGNLLQYYDAGTTATSTDQIQAELEAALPAGLRALAPATATDQDSYTTTREFADTHGLTSIGDLAEVPDPLTIAANSEFATRPYGPEGVREAYGVEVELVPVEDSGGPLTVGALLDGTVQLADVYTANPSIVTNDLVVLEDPENLILPQNVVPVVSDAVDESAAAAIDRVNALLTPEALRSLNLRSVEEELQSSEIASDWLTEQGLV